MTRSRPALTRKTTAAKQGLLSLLRAADRLKGHLARVMEPQNITVQQYNVLRILRGAGPEGLPTLTIADRMIERAPGITRMIDRLERQGWVERQRRGDDRRCIQCRITRAGLELLARMDRMIDAADRAAFHSLTARELAQLTALLEKVRLGLERPAR
jgi:DNA-binding MarR family transcriptional regulator